LETGPYTLGMARHLVRLSGGEHLVIDDSTPPNGTGFLTESPYEALPPATPTVAALSTYTLGPLAPETVMALKSATTLVTQ
jgi:hypothetical protein